MQRRTLGCIVILTLGLLGRPLAADTPQRAHVPRVGMLSTHSAPTAGAEPPFGVFRQALRELGYIEGHNILVEYRYTEGRRDRIPGLVAELVHLPVDVLVLQPSLAIRAAKQATTTIPIVMVATVDPVATGLVESLARPGGNITGLTEQVRELSPKRLGLLTELLPVSRVGVLWEPASPPATQALQGYEAAARTLKIELHALAVHGPNPDLAGAFRAVVEARVGALIVIQSALTDGYSQQIADLARTHRLPSLFDDSRPVREGGLVSYATKAGEQWRRAASYVHKILQGAKPGDLPVEQPMQFELVINLKTAKALGLTIPPTFLFQADQVIQ
jgi:putative tryptophan/tyrosine transport system substrate-binding protein